MRTTGLIFDFASQVVNDGFNRNYVQFKMTSPTIKPRGRCSGGCIPETSGMRCAYCHFELCSKEQLLVNQKEHNKNYA